MKNDALRELGYAINRYENRFKSPFPTAVTRSISDGMISAEEVLARVVQAIALGRADPEWEAAVPCEGTIDYELYYKPRLRQLLASDHALSKK